MSKPGQKDLTASASYATLHFATVGETSREPKGKKAKKYISHALKLSGKRTTVSKTSGETSI
jgi:hypothetical protein